MRPAWDATQPAGTARYGVSAPQWHRALPRRLSVSCPSRARARPATGRGKPSRRGPSRGSTMTAGGADRSLQARDIVAFGQEYGRILSDGRIVGRAEPFAKVFPSSRAVKRAVGADRLGDPGRHRAGRPARRRRPAGRRDQRAPAGRQPRAGHQHRHQAPRPAPRARLRAARGTPRRRARGCTRSRATCWTRRPAWSGSPTPRHRAARRCQPPIAGLWTTLTPTCQPLSGDLWIAPSPKRRIGLNRPQSDVSGPCRNSCDTVPSTVSQSTRHRGFAT